MLPETVNVYVHGQMGHGKVVRFFPKGGRE